MAHVTPEHSIHQRCGSRTAAVAAAAVLGIEWHGLGVAPDGVLACWPMPTWLHVVEPGAQRPSVLLQHVTETHLHTTRAHGTAERNRFTAL